MPSDKQAAGVSITLELVCRGPGIYSIEGLLPFLSCSIPARMMVIVLNKKPGPSPVSSPVASPVKKGLFGGSKPARVEELLLISPFAPTDELVALVKTLGTVKFVLAPNTMHHL
jgi:hypothetical protein